MTDKRPERLLIKNGRVHLPNESGGRRLDVLINDTVLEQIGKGLAPSGAAVLDAQGLDVYPGLILPLCSVGAAGLADGYEKNGKDENSSPLTPAMDIRHSFDIEEYKRQRFTQFGITSYGLSPGTSNLLGGMMSYVRASGKRTEDIWVRRGAALKGNFIPDVLEAHGRKNGPMTHMEMFRLLDECFAKASNKMASPEAQCDPGEQMLLRVLRGELPFFVNAYSQSEIESIIELGEKYSISPVICGAYAIAGCAERIMKHGWQVVLGDPAYFNNGLKYATDLKRLLELFREGLRLSLSCCGDVAYPPGYAQLLRVASLMRQAGATGDELIRMTTENPAAALGVSALAGTIEKGKNADLILTRGDPFLRFDDYIEYTIVAGQIAYARKRERL